jgi:meso-butanediol dehydrogenase/(S,S)-butanediol dehydrogenase/diacetyl reductase
MAEITGAEIGASYEEFVGGIALGRAQTPEDVAAFVSYLAGPDSDYMTGQIRLGTDRLLVNAKGESKISFEDYAIVLVDELETRRHSRQRFTIGYW